MGYILWSKSNRIAGSATGAALLAMEEKMAGHAIVINCGVFWRRQINIDLPVGLCCGPEEDNCDFPRIFLWFCHFLVIFHSIIYVVCPTFPDSF